MATLNFETRTNRKINRALSTTVFQLERKPIIQKTK